MLIVAGITRSGLTVTMQMLHAGGYPCMGEYPAFECFDIGKIPWRECEGFAVKAVDAQLQNPPDSACKVIRLRRNLVEQCKSINKWNNLFGPLDLQSMENVVVKRGTACHPTVMELQMIGRERIK